MSFYSFKIWYLFSFNIIKKKSEIQNQDNNWLIFKLTPNCFKGCNRLSTYFKRRCCSILFFEFEKLWYVNFTLTKLNKIIYSNNKNAQSHCIVESHQKRNSEHILMKCYTTTDLTFFISLFIYTINKYENSSRFSGIVLEN